MNGSSSLILDKKPPVFVLGGAGYIGSHVSKALYKSGYTPIVIDNLCHGYRESVLWGPLYEKDIRDGESLVALLKKHQPVAVVHLAAYLAVGESVQDPHKYYLNNVEGALSLLNALKKTSWIPVVFSSTAAVYGSVSDQPIRENYAFNPLNPYGQSKRMVEQMLSDYEKAYSLPSVSLRYFNAAGADPELETGSRQIQPFNLIPLILQVLSGKRAVLDVYGDDYPTEDGTCIRDYIHVSDLATAHVKAVEKLLNKEKLPLAMNLGTGNGYSVKQVLACMEEVSGKKIPFKIASRRAGDGAILVADSSLAKEKLNWQPVYSDLHTIAQTAWNWHCHYQKT